MNALYKKIKEYKFRAEMRKMERDLIQAGIRALNEEMEAIEKNGIWPKIPESRLSDLARHPMQS